MSDAAQVNRDHYAFERYMTKERWDSVWHQLDEVIRLKPDNVLEIGPGAGLFKKAAAAFGVKVETLDLDPALEPDHLGSATALPFPDGAFDVVCAFQMLEHIPYESSLIAFDEMSRVARDAVVISLPDAWPLWRYFFWIPRVGRKRISIPKPFYRARRHAFDGQHHWEINKLGYDLDRVAGDFSRIRPLLRTYRGDLNPYHRFFIFGAREPAYTGPGS